MFLAIKKVVLATSVALLVSSWLLAGQMAMNAVRHPRSPDHASGNIITYKSKAGIVYITRYERRLLTMFGNLIYASGATALIIILVHGGDPFRGKGW